MPVLTPLNMLLAALFVVILYYQLRPRPAVTLPKPAPPIVFRTFTPRTLLPYNGRGSSDKTTTTTTTTGADSGGGAGKNGAPEPDKASIYIAIRGTVFDVTPGANFYGPRGPYANFAGRDASRGLALGSFDDDVLTHDLDGPLDALADLDAEQRESLADWEQRCRDKSLVGGRLVAEGSQGVAES